MDFLPKNLNIDVKIGKKLGYELENIVKSHGFEVNKAILVSDDNIFNNCKEFLPPQLLTDLSQILILDDPRPNEDNVAKIKDAAHDCELILALGSGTINDLCKYSSHEIDKKYMVITSAASMNGYLSKNASIIVNGHRKTLPASMPIAAICDYDILRSAPKYMTKAGIGDSMCFFSCWFDWLLSHLLLGTDYDAQCFEILMPKMTDFVGNYQNYVLGEDELLKIVVEMLLLSGAAMTMAGNSNPASQSEHLIAHSYSMRFEEKSEKVLHGLQIATTTLTSAKIQEELVVTDQLMLRDLNFNQNAIADFYGAQIASECQGQFGKKSSLINQNVRRLNQELATDWPDYCQVLSRILFSEQNLRQIFQHFDIATGPGALGIEYQEYNEVVGYARFIRDRFTCLDL